MVIKVIDFGGRSNRKRVRLPVDHQ